MESPNAPDHPHRVSVVSRLTQQQSVDGQGGSQVTNGEPSLPIARDAPPSSPRLTGEEGAGNDVTALPWPGECPVPVRTVLGQIAVGDDVLPGDLAAAFQAVCGVPAPTRDVVLGSLLTAVIMRGPLADDVEALLRSALAMDDRASPAIVSGGAPPVLLLAGSGKKGLRTLNVSTPAALVAAAVGARVIKVGSAATSSALGSRDLVRALGLREHRTVSGVRADLGACGFAFIAVEPEIPALDRLYGGRFHAPNPFSFGLAPLTSPVRGEVTIFGLSHPRVDVAAEVLSRFGLGEVDVLSTRLPGGHYLDEIGMVGDLRRCGVRDGVVGPVEVDVIECGSAAVGVATSAGPAEAVDRTTELLAGDGLDSHRAMVAINSAFLLVRSGLARSWGEGRELAEDALRSGTVLTKIATAQPTGRRA